MHLWGRLGLVLCSYFLEFTHDGQLTMTTVNLIDSSPVVNHHTHRQAADEGEHHGLPPAGKLRHVGPGQEHNQPIDNEDNLCHKPGKK